MANLGLEAFRNYARAYSVPIDNSKEACIDGRNPLKNAGFLARGGSSVGRAMDFADALLAGSSSDHGLVVYPPEMIVLNMHAIARRNSWGFSMHTDSHALHEKSIMTNPEKDPIGCKYLVVARSRTTNVRVLSTAISSYGLENEELLGEHAEMAIVIDDSQESSFPHQAEGVSVFKITRARDIQRSKLFLAELNLPGITPENKFDQVLEVFDKNLMDTVGAIPATRGMSVYRAFTVNGVYEVEELGVVGNDDIKVYTDHTALKQYT